MSPYIVNTWRDVAAVIDSLPQGRVLHVPKRELHHPTDEGARESIGMPQGQQGDFRFMLQDNRCLHVKVFDDRYEAHIDRADPAHSWVEHLRKDLPGGYVATTGGTGTAIGAIVGLIVGRKKEAMLVGGMIGGLLGLLAGAATLPVKGKKTREPESA